jgi:hypothetical protein
MSADSTDLNGREVRRSNDNYSYSCVCMAIGIAMCVLREAYFVCFHGSESWMLLLLQRLRHLE